ncbi:MULTISPECIES: DUF2837 family protein [Comamonas]|uniref:DUF2837 family protein n=1 Tax=Comamonas TaxID=283 RepID=UPI00237EADA0|nr:DUF2837 family protein [Comamonas aquatica]MDE1554886.1 DUF2837 family protein [Comamonas aquatica]
MNVEYIIFFLCFALAIFYVIETSSWLIKSVGCREEVGRLVALTNIYLYMGRMFFVFFSVGSSYLVDKFNHNELIYRVAFLSLFFAAFIQLFIVKFRIHIQKIIIRLLKKTVEEKIKTQVWSKQVFFSSFVATLVLSFGYVFPFLAASIFYDLRMTMASIGQFINAFAGVVLLFLLDPLLYKSMDKGDLYLYMNSYLFGRFCGVGLASLIVGLFWGWQ